MELLSRGAGKSVLGCRNEVEGQILGLYGYFSIPRARISIIASAMGKGYETHQARVQALQGLGKDLARRAKSKCELTGVSGVPLKAYEVPPVTDEPDIDRTLLVSEACLEVLEHPKRLKGREWQGLAEIVWSEMPAVQVVAWRMLTQLAKYEDWAREVVEEVFLDEAVEAWAKSDLL
jgi:protein PhnA